LQLGDEYARKPPWALCKKFVHVAGGRLEGFDHDEDDNTD
jgi:hypothetical protein